MSIFSRIARGAAVVALISSANFASGADVPAPRTDTAGTALFSGLPSLAAEIARDALGEKNLSNAEREQLLLTLSGAQLALGDYAAAGASIEGIAGDSPRRKLREAFVAVSRERYSEALAALDGLSAEAFPREERAWFFLARGIAGAFLFGSDSARADFDAAAADAGSEALREHISFLRMWADVSARANVPAEELARLKAARDAARGTPDFARAAKLHIVALAKSGQREAALAALRECVPVPEKNVAEFDLLEGLLAEKMSGEAARAAFERVVRARPSRALQSAAFSGLLQGVRDFQNAGKKEEAILAANAIEKFLSSLAPDESVRDLELFTRARLAFDIGNLRLSETLADELNSRFPASPFVPDSLRLLVGIAVKEKEYRRAVPLLERLLSTELSPEERVQTDVLIADCRFLSGDYALAADAYARVSASDKLSGDALGTIFFQQALSEVRCEKVSEAAALLDSELAKRVPAPWTMRTECIVIEALQQAGLFSEAAARAKKFLERKDLLPDFYVRILWIQALVALELNDSSTAANNADLIANAEANFDSNISERLRKTAPDLAGRSMLLKARALFQAGKDADALNVLAEVRERFPDSPFAVISWLEEGRRFSEQGKPARALVCYETLIGRYGSQEKFSEYSAIAAFEAAQAAATIGRPEEAVKQMQSLVERHPKSPLAFYARLRQADFFRILNDFDSALAVYDNLIAAQPDHAERRIVEIRRADALSALAARAELDGNAAAAAADARKKSETAYERLFSLPDQPLSLKAEAGYKWAYAVAHSVPATGDAEARERAEKLSRETYWNVVCETLAFAESLAEKKNCTVAEALGDSGGYWLARCLFTLGESYEKARDYDSARGIYAQLVRWSGFGWIPGKRHAEVRLKRILEK